MFLATIVSTTFVNGPQYSLTVMSILLAHEMGHFLVARHHGVAASLPYFIPIPIAPIGTMGAVISMRTDQATRSQLMDIGAAGPICGFLVALPAMIIGAKISTIARLEPGGDYTMFGDSLLSFVVAKVFGPAVPDGYDLLANPVWLGAWAGFLVTALNLLPMGQLDGGHVLFAFAPERASIWYRRVFRVVVVLCVIGLLVQGPEIANQISEKHDLVPKALLEMTRPLHRWFTPGFILIALLARAFGLRHPPVKDLDRPLSPTRRGIAIACAIIFLLTFMPNPMWFMAGS
jgi:membrane-associated protease RseP (regulator of RpoE activity)